MEPAERPATGQGGGSRQGRDGGGRRRRPPELVEVVSVSRLAPRLVSVLVRGGDLSRFAAAVPTSHVKIFLPAAGESEPAMPVMTPDGGREWPGGVRPVMRTYTPRAYDPAAGTLELQFVLHGEGPASEWAQQVTEGGKIAIAGPGGRFAPDPAATNWWIAADESALPAVGTLLDWLPAHAAAEVHLEVAAPEDEIALKSAARVTVTWHVRRNPDRFGAELHNAAVTAAIPGGASVWVACESTAMRDIRRHLLGARQLPAATLVTRGYWRAGVADYPDHDYGE